MAAAAVLSALRESNRLASRPSHKALISGSLQRRERWFPSPARPSVPLGHNFGNCFANYSLYLGTAWPVKLLIEPHFGHCLAVLARVAGAVVDACREIAQHNLPATYLARKHAERLYLMSAGS